MCYPKPGPRCSKVAAERLQRANLAHAQNPNYATYEAKRIAQNEYDMTPEGQQVLREQIAAERDAEIREELQERLDYAIQSRQFALNVVRRSDEGDVLSDEERRATRERVARELAELSDPLQGAPRFGKRLMSNTGYGVHYAYSNPSGIDSDEAPYKNLQVAKIDSEKLVGGLVGVTEYNSESIPTEWVKNVEDSGVLNDVKVNVAPDEYGEDDAEVLIPQSVLDEVAKQYYSQPNATDPDGALSYARSNGVDTTGLSPVDAVKKTLFTEGHDERARIAIEEADAISDVYVSPASVEVPEGVLEDAGSYLPELANKFSAVGSNNDPIPAGVVVSDGRGWYRLVGGAKRFNTIKNQKREVRFLVLGKKYDF